MEWNADILVAVAKAAGIGGIAVVASTMIFRDLLSKKIFPMLTKLQAYKLLRLIAVIGGIISIIGILAWAYISKQPPQQTELEDATAAANDPDLIRANRLFYEDPDYSTSFKIYESLSKKDNKIAMAQLASLLFNGVGTAKDEKQAEYWAKTSVETLDNWCIKLEVPAACFSLSRLYDDGIFVNKNTQKTFELSLTSSTKGYSRSYFSTGYMLYFGEGIKVNHSQGIEWIKKAANEGYPIAIYYLSMIYSDEEFKDEQLSLQLLIKAADLGFPEAQRKLSIVYSDGDGIEKNTEKANILLEKSATAGDEVAQFLIAQNYYFGDNSYPQNYNLAFGWAKKSAEQGNSDAQNLLSTMYEKGQGTAKDQAEAVRLTQLSADQDNKFAQNNMGNIYAFGKGLPQDDKKAFEWYLKSAMQNYKIAQFNIATIYNDGLGIEKKYNRSIRVGKKISRTRLS